MRDKPELGARRCEPSAPNGDPRLTWAAASPAFRVTSNMLCVFRRGTEPMNKAARRLCRAALARSPELVVLLSGWFPIGEPLGAMSSAVRAPRAPDHAMVD